jgi:multimeric flavodoxin WrbA
VKVLVSSNKYKKQETRISNILILNGSPRKGGNTSFLVEELKKIVIKNGHNVKVLFLNDYTINPCKGCFWCYDGFPQKCIQNDFMNTLYPIVIDSEILIFSSPIYWFNYSAQLKLFIDRLVALHVKGGHSLNGRKFATIFVYGDRDPKESGVYTAIESLEQVIRYFKGINLGLIHGTGGDNLNVPNNKKLVKDLRELAEKIN